MDWRVHTLYNAGKPSSFFVVLLHELHFLLFIASSVPYVLGYSFFYLFLGDNFRFHSLIEERSLSFAILILPDIVRYFEHRRWEILPSENARISSKRTHITTETEHPSFLITYWLFCSDRPTNVNRSDYSFALEKLRPEMTKPFFDSNRPLQLRKG